MANKQKPLAALTLPGADAEFRKNVQASVWIFLPRSQLATFKSNIHLSMHIFPKASLLLGFCLGSPLGR